MWHICWASESLTHVFGNFGGIDWIPVRILKHPSASQTTHDWTLALVAYVACWFLWVFGVWLMYEVVYSFWRRWRASESASRPEFII